MTDSTRPSPWRYLAAALAIAAVASIDLVSKRWVEGNLATAEHLLPLEAREAGSVGDLFRSRFPGLSDEELRGSLFVLPPAVPFRPRDPVFLLEARGVDAQGFIVVDEGRPGRFARWLERSDAFGIEKWLMRARPDLPFTEARQAVRRHLQDVTLEDWLSRRVPGLSGEALESTIARGLHPIPRAGIAVRADDPVEVGRTYLLADRKVEILPSHLDLSYAENPNGAWGLLAELDPGPRRTLFCLLSFLAILAMAALVVRPPGPGLAPVLALGAILGGAVGNLVERVAQAYVVDFIHMYWGDQHWPRYNVADIGITVGVVVLVLSTGGGRGAARQETGDAGSQAPTRGLQGNDGCGPGARSGWT